MWMAVVPISTNYSVLKKEVPSRGNPSVCPVEEIKLKDVTFGTVCSETIKKMKQFVVQWLIYKTKT